MNLFFILYCQLAQTYPALENLFIASKPKIYFTNLE